MNYDLYVGCLPYSFVQFLFTLSCHLSKVGLSLKKTVNIALSGGAWIRSLVDSGSTSATGMPLFVSIEPTNRCNLRCPECATGSGANKRSAGNISTELFGRIIEELRPYLLNLNLYFQGEPMLHPQFFTLLEMSRGINTTVSTNGHFISGGNAEKLIASGVGKLIISIDGADQETYSGYRRGGSFSEVINGLEQLTDARKQIKNGMRLEIQMLLNSSNEHQISEVRQKAKNAGASFVLKSMQVLDYGRVSGWMPEESQYQRYKLVDGEYKIKSRLPDRCSRLWFNPVITWDGKVLPCCFDKDGEHIMGDANYTSFREIWNNSLYREFRHRISVNRQGIEICRNCTSGLRGVRY